MLNKPFCCPQGKLSCILWDPIFGFLTRALTRYSGQVWNKTDLPIEQSPYHPLFNEGTRQIANDCYNCKMIHPPVITVKEIAKQEENPPYSPVGWMPKETKK